MEEALGLASRLRLATYMESGGVSFWDSDAELVTEDNTDGYSMFTEIDRLDMMTYRTFGTVHGWWIMAALNKIQLPPVELQPGTLVRMPTTMRFSKIT